MKNYIDLGLPSGNLWCDTNEKGYYNFEDAVEKFGDNMPKLTDFAELYDYCQWYWNEEYKGITVIGPNGNGIFLPAAGYCRDSGGGLRDVGTDGYYWSASSSSYGAYCLYFLYNGKLFVYPSEDDNLEEEMSIRLIKRK